MKKSKAYGLISIAASTAALIFVFIGQSDVRSGILMVLGFVCIAAADILEALGE